MDKSNKTRSRKTKLVPREYSDSDDENIALMQQEIELELANIKAQSILKKLSASSLNEKDFKFSVKVEIENCNDDDDNDNNDQENNDSLPNEDNDTKKIDYSIVNNFISIKTNKANAVACTNEEIETENVDFSIENEEMLDSSVDESSEELEVEDSMHSDDLNDDITDDGDLLTPVKETDFRVESVGTLDKSTNTIVSYKIPDKMIRDEFEFVCKQTTDYADKLLEIYLRNYYARNVTGVLNNCEINLGIQEALKKWKTWQSYPIVRGPPLMYICSKCKLGFWHLHDFQDHLQDHTDMNFSFVSEEHVSYVIAHLDKKADREILSIDSDCWRCGKNFKCHNDVIFKCNGCNRYFETCLLMSIHEGTCQENKNMFAQSENVDIERKCPVCPYKHWREGDIQNHMVGLHSVRTDVPMCWSTKKCRKCDAISNNFYLHECSEKQGTHACMFCLRRFQVKHNIMIHYMMSPSNFECQICKKVLKKECMQLEHLLSHSKSYTSVYKCLVCKHGPYFLSKKLENKHKLYAHKRLTKSIFEQVIVPKSLLKRLENNKKFIRKEVLDLPNSDNELDSTNDSNVNDNIKAVSKHDIEFRQPTHSGSKSGEKRKTKSLATKNPPSVKKKEISTPIKNVKQIIKVEKNADSATECSETNKNKRKSEVPIENDLEIKKTAELNFINIKEEPVDFLDIVAVEMNETDEVDETNDDDHMSVFNKVNGELNLKLEPDVDLPIKYEVKEEPYEAYDEINEYNTMDSDVSLSIVEQHDSRNAYNHVKVEKSEERIYLTDLPQASCSSVITEAQDAIASTSAAPIDEPPKMVAPKSKAEKQREYRKRIAVSRTAAQAIAARKLDAERQRKSRLRKAANLAVVSGSLEPAASSSSQRQLTQQRLTSPAESAQTAQSGSSCGQALVERTQTAWNTKWGSSIMRFELTFLENDFGYACSVCDRLWFKNDLKPITEAQLDVISEWYIKENRQLCKKEYKMVCNTCKRSLNKKSMPPLAKVNGFTYPDQPPGLPPLDPISERLISPHLPFMQVRRLHQDLSCGIIGQVINIPIDVQEMVKSLPRQLNEDDVVNINIKRHLAHKSSFISRYMSENTISTWLNVLKESPLYRLYEINVDLSRMHPICDTQAKPNNCIENISAENTPESEILTSRQHTMMWNEEDFLNIAAGHQATPQNIIHERHAEELSFPSIYFGVPRRFTMGISLTPYMIASSEIRRRDRRGATPQKVLFVAIKILRLRTVNRIYSTFRNVSGTDSVTRCMLEDTEYLKEYVKQNLTFMKTVPNSVQYWASRKRDLLAIIRHLGKPTAFLTISANEIHWIKLLATLLKLSKKYPGKTAKDLNNFERCALVNDDPVTCCIYFYRLVGSLMKMLKSKHSYNPFGKYFVKDYFLRIEFLGQGNPQAHILLWLNDDPRETVSENMSRTINLVEKLSSVARDDVPNNSVYANQMHKHNFTCTNQGETTCKFPYWPMPTTRVLLPIPQSDERLLTLQQKSKELRISLGERRFASMDEFLAANGLTYDSYLDIVRSSLRKPTLVFRRNFNELMTNTFNPYLAGEINSNIEIQFILDEYSCAEYVLEYINKSARGISSLRRELTMMMEKYPDQDLTGQLKALSIKLLNAVEMSAQEAAWYLLGQPMSETSRHVVYIPTVWPTERQRCRKRRSQMDREGIDGDSTDIWIKNIIQRYEERPASLEQVYLAEFASWYANAIDFVDEEDDVNVDDDEDAEAVPKVRASKAPKEYRRRLFGRIIRYRRYDIDETINYKREMVLLYVQFRNEISEHIDQNKFLQLFDDNKDTIMERHSLFETNLTIENIIKELEATSTMQNDDNSNLPKDE